MKQITQNREVDNTKKSYIQTLILCRCVVIEVEKKKTPQNSFSALSGPVVVFSGKVAAIVFKT
jgi:hypothetical protein